MRRRSFFQLALAAAFAITGASCLSPTLPLPPPSVDEVQDAGDGLWTVSGTCEEGAIVTVFNESTGRGVAVKDDDKDGKYLVTIEASLCDQGWASQTTVEEGTGEQQAFIFKPGGGNPGSTCP